MCGTLRQDENLEELSVSRASKIEYSSSEGHNLVVLVLHGQYLKSIGHWWGCNSHTEYPSEHSRSEATHIVIVEGVLYDHRRFTLRYVCLSPSLPFVMGNVNDTLRRVQIESILCNGCKLFVDFAKCCNALWCHRGRRDVKGS